MLVLTDEELAEILMPALAIESLEKTYQTLDDGWSGDGHRCDLITANRQSPDQEPCHALKTMTGAATDEKVVALQTVFLAEGDQPFGDLEQGGGEPLLLAELYLVHAACLLTARPTDAQTVRSLGRAEALYKQVLTHEDDARWAEAEILLNLGFQVMLHQEMEPLTTSPARQLIIGQFVPSIRIFSAGTTLR